MCNVRKGGLGLKYYAKYYHESVDGSKIIPVCGSDSILYLDGRLSFKNMVNRARNHALSLNKILDKDIKYFRIFLHSASTVDEESITPLNLIPVID